jgi:phenylpropionate dioxygenase-like ring-hydroxylating dioxygenase large terminal subunit
MNQLLYPPTLPLSWYADPQILEIEKKVVFALAPDYVGTIPIVPEPNCLYTIPQYDHAEILVRDGEEALLISNICLHRSMLMTKGKEKKRTLVCPMHQWSYNLQGNLLQAPHYRETPCLHLPRRQLQNWNGILFAGKCRVLDDLAALGGRPELDISNYIFVESEQEEQPINWKIPVEVLLENYHVPILHPGLTRYVHPATWYENEGGYDGEYLYYQEMKPHPDFSSNPVSSTFERWQLAILKITKGELPDFGAIISLYYPNIFLEWYPFTFVVTTYTPRSSEQTLMTRDFFYDPKALEIVPDFPKLAKAAWDENQIADDIAHKALHLGRSLQYRQDKQGLSGYEVYQSPTEDSVKLFHARLMHLITPHLQ